MDNQQHALLDLVNCHRIITAVIFPTVCGNRIHDPLRQEVGIVAPLIEQLQAAVTAKQASDEQYREANRELESVQQQLKDFYEELELTK